MFIQESTEMQDTQLNSALPSAVQKTTSMLVCNTLTIASAVIPITNMDQELRLHAILRVMIEQIGCVVVAGGTLCTELVISF